MPKLAEFIMRHTWAILLLLNEIYYRRKAEDVMDSSLGPLLPGLTQDRFRIGFQLEGRTVDTWPVRTLFVTRNLIFGVY